VYKVVWKGKLWGGSRHGKGEGIDWMEAIMEWGMEWGLIEIRKV
jgi:hypothetical protein